MAKFCRQYSTLQGAQWDGMPFALKQLFEFIAMPVVSGGINWAFDNITPLYFQGAIAGSEFLTYDVKKLYVVIGASFTSAAGATTAQHIITLYNEANAINGYHQDNAAYWNATGTAANYVPISSEMQNCFFSKIATSGYAYMKFNGFKLTKN